MKLVFVGGKSAPAGYILGQVYELPERYASFPWFKPAPESTKVGANLGADYGKPPRPEIPKPTSPNEKAPIPEGLTGEFEMVFHTVKSAPSGYKDGEVYLFPIRYARFPWFTLVDPEALKRFKIPPIERTVEQNQPAALVLSEGTYPIIGDASPEEKAEAERMIEEEKKKEALAETEQPKPTVSAELPEPEKASEDETPQEPNPETLKEEVDKKWLDQFLALSTEEQRSKIESGEGLSKLDLMEFIVAKGGTANMKMNRAMLQTAALALLSS